MKGPTIRGRSVWVLALAAWWLLGGSGRVGGQSAAEVIRQVAFKKRINQPLPLELKFRDETGRAVALGDYFGRRPVVLALVYYECPMLCNYVENGLVKALRALTFEPGREFDVVIVSFAPNETPALAAAKKESVLKEYDRARTAAGWHFLTGEPDAIRQLTEAVGLDRK